ncbi:MAG: DUF4282 domain-containing protein [Helicobacteraceae bacterium]|jgi:hypothetical protein|nr:DUF4282 domain-containing protein [Helicobacteraceae bacterium]
MDFLTFKSFISTEALIVFYYIGAIIMPFGAWYFTIWSIRKYEIVNMSYETGKATFWKSLNLKQKSGLIIFLIASFLLMELFWRMLFEFLIAYMQIRGALVQS